MTFDLSSITGNITNATLTLTRASGYGYGTHVSVVIYGSSTSYGSRPTLGTMYVNLANSIDQGQTKTYDVTQAIRNMQSGGIKQLVLDPGDTSAVDGKAYSRHYARYSGVQLTVTWED